jgi:hypothetical protein
MTGWNVHGDTDGAAPDVPVDTLAVTAMNAAVVKRILFFMKPPY